MRKLALAVLAAAAAVATAARAESPRSGSFSLQAQSYVPNIDAEFSGLPAPQPTPYATIFGNGTRWTFKAEAARSVFDKLGTVEIGAGVGYFSASGKGIYSGGANVGQPSPDTTTFNIVPTSLFAEYRFDWLADRYGIPLAPFAKLALERYNWWVTGAGGKTTKSGATNGWSAAGGLAILLDFFDPALAREMDRDTGIHHTYLFVDVSKAIVNDFGSKQSWDLSDKRLAIGFGLTFVF